jgi:SAM-dependent methyltransferase
MNIAPDGSPVELYRHLPERTEEAELIHGLLPEAGTVLDLGCGTGRLSEPLARLGHQVIGIDNEPAMLASLRLTTGICADAADLDLGEQFDAVLLMSHFVNAAESRFVDAVLATVRRHVADTGFAVVERYAPGWVQTCTEDTRTRDGVRYVLRDLVRDAGTLTATIRYEFNGIRAEQRFSTREVDDARLAELAGLAGMSVGSVLNEARTLVLLRPQ